MYIIFGSVRQITIGPASVVALLTFNYVNPELPTTAVILCFVSGIVELICGLFRLGTASLLSDKIRSNPNLFPFHGYIVTIIYDDKKKSFNILSM